jgi:ABC-type glycerol-3-phosphate transport system permease component
MKSHRNEILKHAFIIFLLLLVFVPFYLMITISFKNNQQFATNPWYPQAPFHPENYAVGWAHVGPNIFNTAFVAITTTFFSIAVAILGAFFFARFKMPGSTFLFYVFIILMMYPGIANMVPIFKLVCNLGLYNSHWSLILVGTASAQAFTIYVLKNFIEEIPKDLFDAAEVDGCSLLNQIRYIVVPMCMPIIGTLGVLKAIDEWNNFVTPLIFIRDTQKQLLGVSLMYLEGEATKRWGELMSGYTIAAIPLIILFIFSMRVFIRGLSEGAIKG